MFNSFFSISSLMEYIIIYYATVWIVYDDVHIILLSSSRTLIETRTTSKSRGVALYTVVQTFTSRGNHWTAHDPLVVTLQFVNGVLKHIFNCGRVYDRWTRSSLVYCDVRSLLTARVSTISNYTVYERVRRDRFLSSRLNRSLVVSRISAIYSGALTVI